MTHVSRRLAVLVALLVLVLLGAGGPVRAFASTATADIMIGLAVVDAYMSQGWHDGNALDIQDCSGCTNSGISVYSQTVGTNGAGMTAYKVSYYGNCTGIKASYKVGSTEVGRTAYVHISPSGSIPSSWSMNGWGWTVEYLGPTLASEVGGCSFTGAHLHQSEEVSSNRNSISGGSTYTTSSTWLEHISD